MSNRDWLVVALACGAGIVGLLLAASGGGEGTTYTLGLGLFVAAVIYAFYFVKRYFDRVDQAQH